MTPKNRFSDALFKGKIAICSVDQKNRNWNIKQELLLLAYFNKQGWLLSTKDEHYYYFNRKGIL